MTRGTFLALLVLALALAASVAGAMIMIEGDRRALVSRFAEERLKLVDEAAKVIDADLADVGQDILFAGQLVQDADSAADRTRELSALMAVVSEYVRFHVYDREGGLLLVVGDPKRTIGFGGDLDGIMRETVGIAMQRQAGHIVTTPPLAAQGGWFRVFATRLPPADGRTPGAVAMLVDTEPLLRKVRLVASDPSSHLLLLGTHGRPTPVTDAILTARIAELDAGSTEFPAFSELLRRMRAGERGVVRVGEQEARRLGLEGAEARAAFTNIPTKGGGHWAMATVNSTVSLRSHERAIILRLGSAAGAVALLLIGFGAFLVVTSRRAVAVRERLRHADRLAHLHEKNEKILDQIPTGVLAISADGRITTANRVLRERIPDVAIGGPLATAFPEAPASVVDRIAALVEEARSTAVVKSLHGERMALFGAEGQYSVHAVPLEARFDEARVLLVVEDLSEVKNLESQLLRAEKLATVGVLAAGIAHEIGTPLGVIRGRAEYILGKLGAESPHSAGMTVIVEQIDRVSRTIRQLLDFSRVKPAVVRPIEVESTARAVAELLRFESERRKLALDVLADPDLPAVSANGDQLQQVLVNLVMNAFDASSPGGRVEVRANKDAPDGSSWRRVRIEVVDHGTGIPEEQQHQVFDPFFTTKKRGKGTGLGLTIAAEIVRNHGGQIELSSAPGEGTSVTLLWPAASDAPSTHQPEERHVAGA